VTIPSQPTMKAGAHIVTSDCKCNVKQSVQRKPTWTTGCGQKLAHADAMTSHVVFVLHVLESPLYNVYSERDKKTIDMMIYLYITYCVP